MLFQRGVNRVADESREDSILELFQGRRPLFLAIASLLVVSAAGTFFLTNNGFAAMGDLFNTTVVSATKATSVGVAATAANPQNGLPIEVPLNKDIGLALYRNQTTRDKVIAFYTNLAGSADIAQIVIKVANHYNVPLSLAFALAWKESKFEPRAVNDNGNSVDRGLYQLNSLSFPGVKPQDFFDPAINAEKGLGYLSRCLKAGGNEVVGLAMYNAGMSRVYRDGTPRVTLDYISTILKYQDAVVTQFHNRLLRQAEVQKVVRSIDQLNS